MENTRGWRYECDEEQDVHHLFACPLLPIQCRKKDFNDDSRYFRQGDINCCLLGREGDMKTDDTRRRRDGNYHSYCYFTVRRSRPITSPARLFDVRTDAFWPNHWSLIPRGKEYETASNPSVNLGGFVIIFN